MVRNSLKATPNAWQDIFRRAKEQLEILQVLEGHPHIRAIVGSYWRGSKKGYDCNILMFPVTTCDLGTFLGDYLALAQGNDRYNQTFQAFGFSDDIHGIAATRKLTEAMGCLTEAPTWIHERGIWHNELIPSHILLGRREVFLSNFLALRYAKGREDADVKVYRSDIWSSGDYLLPEIETSEMYNGKETDVYSLGCVFLQILAAIYTPSIAQPWIHNWEYRDGALNEIASSARADMLPTKGGQFKRPFISTKLIAILGRMTADDEEQRPTMEDVGQALKAANHLEGIFYGPCCSPSRDLRPLELLKSWKHYGTYWAGIGNQFDVEFSHLKPDFQTQLSDETGLAEGVKGQVFRVSFRGMFLAKKSLYTDSHSVEHKERIRLYKKEFSIGEKLDRHHHIVTMVRTYWGPAKGRLNIHTYPVATCDLGRFLENCEVWGGPERLTLSAERGQAITVQFEALGYDAKGHFPGQAASRLLAMMGCVEAVR